MESTRSVRLQKIADGSCRCFSLPVFITSSTLHVHCCFFPTTSHGVGGLRIHVHLTAVPNATWPVAWLVVTGGSPLTPDEVLVGAEKATRIGRDLIDMVQAALEEDAKAAEAMRKQYAATAGAPTSLAD